MKKISMLSVSAFVILSLLGCGSSSSENDSDDANTQEEIKTVTGQFVDSNVSGLNYLCAPSLLSGLTNAHGEFTCNEGDSVEFSLGSYILGSVAVSAGIVRPADLYPDSPASALNVAQLLQSLDTDASDNIISIAENFVSLNGVEIALDDANFDELMGQALNIELVGEVDAQAHLDGVEIPEIGVETPEVAVDLAAIFLETTQYSVNTRGTITTRTFDANGNYTGFVTVNGREEQVAAGTSSIADGVITINRTTPMESEFVVTYMSHTDGEVILSSSMNGGDPFDTYFYTDEARRDLKMQEIQALLATQ